MGVRELPYGVYNDTLGEFLLNFTVKHLRVHLLRFPEILYDNSQCAVYLYDR